MPPVLQTRLRPDTPRPGEKLPGARPLDLREWLVVDDAFAGQMALRDALIARRRGEVLALDPEAGDAARELLDVVLGRIAANPLYRMGAAVRRPDGVVVDLDRNDPMVTAGRLVAEDLCLLDKRDVEHVLVAAVLCFPSRWRLDEKIGRPLTRIHRPVAPYDGEVARRVQRLFDGLRPERPLWRANLVRHRDPALFQPVSETEKDRGEAADAGYLRSERQCLLRLPVTGAVVFSIHTTLVRAGSNANGAPRKAPRSVRPVSGQQL
jgi:hypothetical protein